MTKGGIKGRTPITGIRNFLETSAGELTRRLRKSQAMMPTAGKPIPASEQNAIKKLRAKGVDLLVVNDVSAPRAGFEHLTNEVVILDRDEHAETVTLRSKEAISYEILARVAALLPQGEP